MNLTTCLSKPIHLKCCTQILKYPLTILNMQFLKIFLPARARHLSSSVGSFHPAGKKTKRRLSSLFMHLYVALLWTIREADEGGEEQTTTWKPKIEWDERNNLNLEKQNFFGGVNCFSRLPLRKPTETAGGVKCLASGNVYRHERDKHQILSGHVQYLYIFTFFCAHL